MARTATHPPTGLREGLRRLPPALTAAAHRIPVWLVYLLGFVPFALLVRDGMTGNLGPDPAKALERALGEWTVIFLIAALAVSPLLRLFRVNLVRFRRALGLLAFWYVALHFAAFAVFDQGGNLSMIVSNITGKLYLALGFGAVAIMTVLAITSNSASMRLLGEGWRKLHKLIYLAALLGAAHYVLGVKSWPLDMVLYCTALVGLVGLRLVRLRPLVGRPS